MEAEAESATAQEDDLLLEAATPEALLEVLKLQGIFDSLRESIAKQLEQSVRLLAILQLFFFALRVIVFGYR